MSLLLNLDEYVLGELITCFLSFILLCNIFVSFSFYDQRQRYFGLSVISCFFSALFDILSSICATYYKSIPSWVGTVVSTLFYLFLIALAFFISCYAVAVAYIYKPAKKRRLMTLCYIIFAVYVVIIIANIFTGIVFKHDPVLGYVRGPANLIAYVMTAIFSCITVFAVLINKKTMAKRMFIVFMLYPVICCFFVFIQFNNKTLLLTGLASFTALFFGYVAIQADLLEYDTSTGLMTENKLKQQIAQKKGNGTLYVLAIENMKLLHTNMDAAKFNMMILNIGKEFSRIFESSAYHISTSRFAAITKKLDEAVEKGNRIEKYIKNLVNEQELHLPTNIEFHSAVISFQNYDFTYSTLMDVINTMLLKARNSGLKTIQICDESIIANTSKRQNIYNILQKELRVDSEMFQIWYQPVYSFKDKRYPYVEALARLNGTAIGDVDTKEFISVAESKGLIGKLGRVGFEKICKFIAENRSDIPSVAVNASVFQMANSNIVDNILTMIKKYALQPNNIIIEVTEDIFNDDYYFIIVEHMKKLAKAGVRFHLDNFGVGKSNVQRLVALPFTTIKLDRTLLVKAAESKNESTLFSGLARTFKEARFEVVAECVEDRYQLMVANKAGVDYIQGYLSCKPLSPTNCVEFLRKKNW